MKKAYKDKIPQALRILIQENKHGYFGICVDLNIAAEVDKKSSPEELAEIIVKMCISHIYTVVTKNLSPDLLERKADKKFFDIIAEFEKVERKIRLTKKIEERVKQEKEMSKIRSRHNLVSLVHRYIDTISQIVNGSKKLELC